MIDPESGASWRIIQTFVTPVIEQAGVGFEEIAYVNLLKWRTDSSRGLRKLYGSASSR